ELRTLNLFGVNQRDNNQNRDEDYVDNRRDDDSSALLRLDLSTGFNQRILEHTSTSLSSLPKTNPPNETGGNPVKAQAAMTSRRLISTAAYTRQRPLVVPAGLVSLSSLCGSRHLDDCRRPRCSPAPELRVNQNQGRRDRDRGVRTDHDSNYHCEGEIVNNFAAKQKQGKHRQER